MKCLSVDLLPNDEKEQDRLDLLHHIFRLTVGGNLYKAPLSQDVKRILDFGTGTGTGDILSDSCSRRCCGIGLTNNVSIGIWAIDIADEFPNAEVIGTDLSPIQPTWVPPNCHFYVEDVEGDWPYQPGEEFDFVHGRGMGGSISDWGRLYKQIYDNLKPGGWVEMQEYETDMYSDDNTLDNAPLIRKFQQLGDEASAKIGKQFNVAATHKQRLVDAGFVNVRDDVYKVRNPPFPVLSPNSSTPGKRFGGYFWWSVPTTLGEFPGLSRVTQQG